MRRLLICMVLLAGCVPARVPSQLSATPGPPVVVTGDRYENAVFAVERPANWRVITSGADAPPGVIFAAPDDTALIVLSAAPLGDVPLPPATEPDAVRVDRRAVPVGDRAVYAAVAGPAARWADVRPVWERVLASVVGV